MADFEFPPPASGSGDSWDAVSYASGSQGGGFIFPPAQKVDQDQGYEVARQVAEEINSIRDTAVDAGEQVSNLGALVQDYGTILERKVEPWAVPTVSPLFQTINRRADPSFGLNGFLSPSGTPTIQSGWNEKNRLYMAFITPAINRAYEQLNFMVSAVTDPCQLDIAVYVVNPDRQVVRQLRQDNVGAAIGTGQSLVTATFPRWVATQGSYIGVAFRQHGTGNARSLLGVLDAQRPLGNIVFPRRLAARSTVTSLDLVQSIDGENQLDFESNWFVPYVELSENVGFNYRNFTESWPDVSEIGRPWVPMTSRGINSGGGHTAASGVGVRVSMYDTPLSTDHVRVSTSIARIFNSSEPSTLIVRASNDLRSGLGLQAIPHHDGFSIGRYELITWSNQSPSRDWLTGRTVIGTINLRPQAGHTIEVDYIDGLVTVRINANPYLTDQAVAGHSGAAQRFVGIQNERSSSGGLFPSYFPSPWFGPWTARDLPQAPEGDNDQDEGEGEQL